MHQYKLLTSKASKLTHLNRCLYHSTISHTALIIRVIKKRFLSTLFKDTSDFSSKQA